MKRILSLLFMVQLNEGCAMEPRNGLEAEKRDHLRVMHMRDAHGKLCYRCTGCNRCTFGVELNKRRGQAAKSEKDRQRAAQCEQA